jgi:hypothetical protein
MTARPPPRHPLVPAHHRLRRRTGVAVAGAAARINADDSKPLITEGENGMMYFERNQPHCLVWPALGFGRDDLHGFWIGIGWLNMEIGWKEKSHEQIAL